LFFFSLAEPDRENISTDGVAVLGVTSVDDKLIVFLYRNIDQIAVYSVNDYQLTDVHCIPGLEPRIHNDIVSCEKNKCVYISDSNDSCIHKLYKQNFGRLRLRLRLTDCTPCGLSVTPDCNLLVMCRGKPNKLVELRVYSDQCVREIALQSDIVDPWHAVQLTTGQYVVCHGSTLSDLHRVCVVDDDGNVTHTSYSGHDGTDTMSCPSHLAVDNDTQFVFVADHVNDRILGLGPQAHFFIRGLSWPWRLHMHDSTRRLYVGHWTDGVTVVHL